MVQDLVHNLCESLVENIDGVAGIGKKTPPTPITYLTQWKIVGNSEVHTLPYPDGVVLPTGYKRCEYLQSDGTAYIEVPFGFYKTDEVYAKAAMLEIADDTYFVSPKTWNDANNRYAMGVHSVFLNGAWTKVFVNAYGNQGTSGGGLIPYIAADNAIREWEYKNYICSMGGSTKDNSQIPFGSETDNLRLFYGYNAPTECKICEYRHKKANAEYRLIPCLDSNDTPCMYDVINNQTYYNSAGSGSFTYKLYPQPTEIWSCGEYNATDGKYHILVQPQGGRIADIALTEPLRKVNDVADTIDFPSDTEGKALVTRKNIFIQKSFNGGYFDSSGTVFFSNIISDDIVKIAYGDRFTISICNKLETSYISAMRNANMIATGTYNGAAIFRNYEIEQTVDAYKAWLATLGELDLICQLATPTTELVDAPQIAEADSYSMVISQDAKAVSWSSFETD